MANTRLKYSSREGPRGKETWTINRPLSQPFGWERQRLMTTDVAVQCFLVGTCHPSSPITPVMSSLCTCSPSRLRLVVDRHTYMSTYPVTTPVTTLNLRHLQWARYGRLLTPIMTLISPSARPLSVSLAFNRHFQPFPGASKPTS